MTKISRMNSLTFSRRTAAAAMKKLTFLLFMLVVCIFLFQYMGLGRGEGGEDNVSSRVHSTAALRDNPNPIVLLYSSTSKSKVNGSYSSFTKRRITGSPLSNSTTTTAAAARTSGVSGLNMEIPREYSGRRIYSFKEIVQMLFDGHRSAYSKKPLWSTKADKQLIYTKSEMEKPVDKKYTSSSYKDKDGMYAPLYHNLTLFKRNYELMEKTLKIYIYKEGEDPIFHHPDFLTGTYGVEGWFMKILESTNLHNFVTENPDEAQLFYIPFSSVHLRIKLGDSPGKATHIRYMKNYLDMIVDKYPYWNRTGGADHFFVACHDWSEFITRDIMSSCIRALCDSDIYNPFIYGKDVSLPTTRVYGSTNPLLNVGGSSPSKRKTLAFFAGQMHGYIRPILLHHWSNNIDPDIKVYGSSIAINGSVDYVSYMRGSKYCICPRGFASFGPRFMEAIYFECVPVLISDNYIPPFSDVLNWETFAVFVKEKDIPRLKEILVGIPERSYLRMYMRVKMVQRHFLWHNQPIKYDVFHMILYSVWINRVLQFQPGD